MSAERTRPLCTPKTGKWTDTGYVTNFPQNKKKLMRMNGRNYFEWRWSGYTPFQHLKQAQNLSRKCLSSPRSLDLMTQWTYSKWHNEYSLLCYFHHVTVQPRRLVLFTLDALKSVNMQGFRPSGSTQKTRKLISSRAMQSVNNSLKDVKHNPVWYIFLSLWMNMKSNCVVFIRKWV